MYHQSTLNNKSSWIGSAFPKLKQIINVSADTHLMFLKLPAFPDIDFYFKDESTHPSGSLKHRLARSLFLYAICNGWVHEGTNHRGGVKRVHRGFGSLFCQTFRFAVGSSDARNRRARIKFRQLNSMAGAVILWITRQKFMMFRGVSRGKRTDILWISSPMQSALPTGGETNNIAESIFRQMKYENHPVPKWIVTGAGTGGTSATLGRYVRYEQHATQICVVDPENSVFYEFLEK